MRIGGETMAALEAHGFFEQERLRLETRPLEGLIFQDENGQPYKAYLDTAPLQRLLKAAGIEDHHTPHDLRHTCATIIATTGGNILHASAQLRHADASVTLQVYSHLFPI